MTIACNAAAITGNTDLMGKCSRPAEGEIATASMTEGLPACAPCGKRFEDGNPGVVFYTEGVDRAMVDVAETPAQWPAVGDRVAIFYDGGWVPTVRYNTVERLTKTQVILANGDRFRLKDLTKTGDAHGGRTRERLCKIDSPEAERARSHSIYGNVRRDIENLLRPRSRGADSYSSAERETILRDIIRLAEQGIEAMNAPVK